ncbi:hypothetical protein F4860DRAFT_296398 [Xylaria cubensis]|nr:hypothetical protein F4860DRAFT_296398 [Xylaria cubensis]
MEINTEDNSAATPATPTTPAQKNTIKYHLKHSDTAKKTALRTIIKFRDDLKLPVSNNDIFKYTGFTHATGYRVLKDISDHRFHNNPFCDETRGRPRALTEANIDQIIEFLGREDCSLPWANLCAAAGLEFPNLSKPPSTTTVKKAVYGRGWRKCVACSKFWTFKNVADEHDRLAQEMLEKHKLDLAYFKFGPDGKVNVTRKAGTQYCTECIQSRALDSHLKNRIQESNK